jgi:hypothetical protein
MASIRLTATLLLAASLAACTGWVHPLSRASTRTTATTTHVAVTFSGGHDTDPRDNGRPVMLIAAALGVPTEVFRTAFSGVTPAGAGEQPQAEQVDLNKAALLRVLGPYGVTNARLDEVSNYYRYNASAGESWPTRSATAVATVRAGKVVAISVTDGGAGYTSPPSVSVRGADTSSAAAEVSFGVDLHANGAVTSVRVS